MLWSMLPGDTGGRQGLQEDTGAGAAGGYRSRGCRRIQEQGQDCGGDILYFRDCNQCLCDVVAEQLPEEDKVVSALS